MIQTQFNCSDQCLEPKAGAKITQNPHVIHDTFMLHRTVRSGVKGLNNSVSPSPCNKCTYRFDIPVISDNILYFRNDGIFFSRNGII